MVFGFITLLQTPVLAQDLDQGEIVKMQKQANEAIARGDYSNAIISLSQAVRIAPSNVALRRDLAYAYYLSGDLTKASNIINEVVQTTAADEPTYQIAAAIEAASGNTAKAKKILNTGIQKYPQSALLYYSRGNLFAGEKKTKDAVTNWQKGIIADPNFASNYYGLAKHYFVENPIWSIIYSEIFVNLESDTKRTAEMKALLLKAYTAYFKVGDNALPAFQGKKNIKVNNANDFTAVYNTIIDKSVSSLVNGITTESLVMLRTRFILEWRLNYATEYPFSLYAFHDKLLREGLFDAYNQWLLGAVENSSTYAIWLKNNAAVVGKMEHFLQKQPLNPSNYDPRP